MSCICCGADETRQLYTVRDISFGEPGEWPFVVCLSCGHGFLHPQPSERELRALYEGLYTAEKKAEMVRMGKGGFERRLQDARARTLEELSGEVGRIVDVGCGMGFSLARLRRSFPSAECIGFELSPDAAEEASKLEGLDIRNIPFAEHDLPEASADIVTMNHVLEHLPDPGSELRQAVSLLRPGGLLLVEVPRLGGWGRRTFGRWWWGHLPPQHLHLFHIEGLSGLLEAHGARVESVRVSGYPAIFSMTLIVWVRACWGSYSPHYSNPLVRIPAFVIGLLLLPCAMVLDLLATPLLNRGSGDIVTVAARKG
jgi:SAM-dependent methyltransferase